MLMVIVMMMMTTMIMIMMIIIIIRDGLTSNCLNASENNLTFS